MPEAKQPKEDKKAIEAKVRADMEAEASKQKQAVAAINKILDDAGLRLTVEQNIKIVPKQ